MAMKVLALIARVPIKLTLDDFSSVGQKILMNCFDIERYKLVSIESNI